MIVETQNDVLEAIYSVKLDIMAHGLQRIRGGEGFRVGEPITMRRAKEVLTSKSAHTSAEAILSTDGASYGADSA